jgi:hypothetical protein
MSFFLNKIPSNQNIIDVRASISARYSSRWFEFTHGDVKRWRLAARRGTLETMFTGLEEESGRGAAR